MESQRSLLAGLPRLDSIHLQRAREKSDVLKKFAKGDTELNVNKSLRASGFEIFFPNLKKNYKENLDTLDEDEEESSENDGNQRSENFIENDEETAEFNENDEAKENFYQTLLDRKAPLSEDSDDKVKLEQARIDNMFLCDRDADSGISQENLTQVQVLILSYSFNIYFSRTMTLWTRLCSVMRARRDSGKCSIILIST